MEASTQQQILSAFTRGWAEAGRIYAGKAFTYEQGIAIFRHYYGPSKRIPVSAIYETVAGDVLSPFARNLFSLEFLVAHPTTEALTTFLASQPEPPPDELAQTLRTFNNMLPQLGKSLGDRVRRFPHPRGGRPRMLASANQRQAVRDEIKALRGPGSRLEDIMKRVAKKYGVSVGKIKQVWGTPD